MTVAQFSTVNALLLVSRSDAAVARAVGCSPGTVCRVRRLAGIPPWRAAAPALAPMPRIGQPWPGVNGVYAGLARGLLAAFDLPAPPPPRPPAPPAPPVDALAVIALAHERGKPVGDLIAWEVLETGTRPTRRYEARFHYADGSLRTFGEPAQG